MFRFDAIEINFYCEFPLILSPSKNIISNLAVLQQFSKGAKRSAVLKQNGVTRKPLVVGGDWYYKLQKSDIIVSSLF